MSRVLIAFAGLCMCTGVLVSVKAQKPANGGLRHHTYFAPEDENHGFEDATFPSDVVLNALLRSEEANDTKEIANYDRESLRKLFTVARVDLGNAKEEDYIALGTQPMSGADNNWFWIVRVVEGKAKVILFTNGLAVRVLPHKTNGYYDIEESWAGNIGEITRVYRYIGTAYKLAHEHFKKANP
jgi:hypothetical protein